MATASKFGVSRINRPSSSLKITLEPGLILSAFRIVRGMTTCPFGPTFISSSITVSPKVIQKYNTDLYFTHIITLSSIKAQQLTLSILRGQGFSTASAKCLRFFRYTTAATATIATTKTETAATGSQGIWSVSVWVPDESVSVDS